MLFVTSDDNLLQYFVFKKRGIEIIPFVHFWMMIPGLVIVCDFESYFLILLFVILGWLQVHSEPDSW